MIAVGIDPSLTASGVACPDGRCVIFGTPGITSMSMFDQIREIGNLVTDIAGAVAGEQPDLVVMEHVDLSQSYGGAAERTYLFYRLLEEFIDLGIRVETAASAIGKMYATGKGTGVSKGDVIEAIARQWPHFQITGNDNKADAAAYCALGMHILGEPLSTVTKDQLRAITRTKGMDYVPPKKATRKKAT